MKPTRTISLVLALAAALLTACAGSGGDQPSGDASRPGGTPGGEPEPSADRSAPETGEVPQATLDLILDDAARRTGLEPSEIEVTQATAVEWSDGSLGCPEPGQMYTQAIEPGYQVLLDADGVELDYRATVRGVVRLCESPDAPFGG
jgi:hypothetical protein